MKFEVEISVDINSYGGDRWKVVALRPSSSGTMDLDSAMANHRVSEAFMEHLKRFEYLPEEEGY